jgi:hypothetical protein
MQALDARILPLYERGHHTYDTSTRNANGARRRRPYQPDEIDMLFISPDQMPST